MHKKKVAKFLVVIYNQRTSSIYNVVSACFRSGSILNCTYPWIFIIQNTDNFVVHFVEVGGCTYLYYVFLAKVLIIHT